MSLLFWKLALAPLLVAGASLAGRRWGLKVSGWLSGFPIVAGPILLFFAVEQGDAFAAAAAQKTLLGLLGFGAFVLTYGWASLRWQALTAISAGWGAFFLVSSLVFPFQFSVVPSLGLAIGGLTAVGRLLPERDAIPQAKVAPRGHSPYDLPLRMAATALLVLGLTGLARLLGPALSGILTPFPVATAVLAGFAQLRGGPGASAQLLSGSLMGMFGFSSFCAVLSLTLVPWGKAGAFGAAFAMVLAVQATVMLWSRRKT